MKHSMLRSWLSGALVVVVAHGLWFAYLLRTGRAFVSVNEGSGGGHFYLFSAVLLWGSPLVAAFLTAYLTPSKKVLLGATLALPAALVTGVVNGAYGALGNQVDFAGFRGAQIVVLATLPWELILCTLGAAIGYLVTRRR